jgi:hypothetical protein
VPFACRLQPIYTLPMQCTIPYKPHSHRGNWPPLTSIQPEAHPAENTINVSKLYEGTVPAQGAGVAHGAALEACAGLAHSSGARQSLPPPGMPCRLGWPATTPREGGCYGGKPGLAGASAEALAQRDASARACVLRLHAPAVGRMHASVGLPR